MSDTTSWLDDICSLRLAGRNEAAFDLLYRTVDHLMTCGEFALVDDVLRDLELCRFDDALLLGFLTITGAGRNRLPSRVGLYKRIRARLEKSEPRDVDALLQGLE